MVLRFYTTFISIDLNFVLKLVRVFLEYSGVVVYQWSFVANTKKGLNPKHDNYIKFHKTADNQCLTINALMGSSLPV